MAFRTNKVPAIEERTVSGSSVSFHSAFALPLKACKVSFMATQSGSGTPSRQNPRPFNTVNQIGITANTTPVVFALEDDYYGGVLDIVNKKIYATYRKYTISTTPSGWAYNSLNSVFFHPLGNYPAKTNGYIYCDIIEPVLPSQTVTEDTVFCGRTSYFNTMINVKVPTTITTATQFHAEYGGANIVYELDTPIEIDLSDIPDLSSILGNNTFSTDTGTLEITFADLQEKSTSGSVATFNTALAMPLVECKTEFMCTQEAGTPSPSNPLAITGVDEVAIQHGGVNLFTRQNEQLYSYLREDGTIYYYEGTPWTLSDFIPVIPNTTYHFNPNTTAGGTAKHGYYDVNKNFISAITSGEQTFTTPSNAYYMRFSYRDTSTDIMLNFGSTAQPYEPYISNPVTLIDLDGTRYGGYVDVVGNKCVLTHIDIDMGNVDYAIYASTGTYSYNLLNNAVGYNGSNLCSYFKKSSVNNIGNMDDLSFIVRSDILYLRNTAIPNDAVAFKASLTGQMLVYELATPIEISLSDIPTLSTIIGNNSFASDSESIELKYKDLDIAKRGSFREVFKLPS